jgi:beta-barrel assembly-enhancing protease
MKFKRILTLLLLVHSACFGFSAYSNKELDELEKQFKKEINQSPQVLRTPLAERYINQVARRLARHGQMQKPYFFIVKSKEINAFAGPGGYIGVNTELILASQNESELAAVMAHEMAHVRLHHLYRMIEHQKQMQIPKLAGMLAAIALGIINPTLGTGAMLGTMDSFEKDTISFIRSNEKEADSIGIDILNRAHYDPEGMPSFFKKMQMNTRYYYSANIPAILRTHPLDEDRIAEADNRIAQMKLHQNISSSPQYYLFKELVRHEVPHSTQQLFEYYAKQCSKNSPEYACRYGLALNYQEINQHQQSIQILEPLVQSTDVNDPFLNLALAQSYEAIGQKAQAKEIYQKFYDVTPNNTAVLDQYSEFLESSDPRKNLSLLLKAHRQFKNDLNICYKLARAQAQLRLLAQAYFTEATCHAIQGEKKAALTQLNVAKKYTKANSYMAQRIDAKIEEIKE